MLDAVFAVSVLVLTHTLVTAHRRKWNLRHTVALLSLRQHRHGVSIFFGMYRLISSREQAGSVVSNPCVELTN